MAGVRPFLKAEDFGKGGRQPARQPALATSRLQIMALIAPTLFWMKILIFSPV
jgi:hypothetical protein